MLNDHLKRLQQFSSGDLTRRVTYIEEQLGVTKVGRRSSKMLTHALGATGKPVERPQAEWLTTEINTQLTRLLFTARGPKWNYETAARLIEIEKELLGSRAEAFGLGREVRQMLDHNITLARSMEDHVLGLQKRLELQLNVVCSAYTHNHTFH
jgi:glutamate-1-semialdehyde 2,1-aminomutase